MNWTDKTALVTGGGSGIGREIARLMYERGAHVIVASLLQQELTTLEASLQGGPGKLTTIAIDLTGDGAVEHLMSAIAEKGLQPTILVNNAGTGQLGKHIDMDTRQVRRILDLNIQVVTELTTLFARRLVERQQSGHILNVASIGAFVAVPQLAAYTASKHYVLAFTHAIAQELAPHDIYVGALCPGITRTKIYDAMGLVAENPGKGSISDRIDVFAMDADQVAECAIDAIERKKTQALPGINKLVPLSRLLPQRLASWLMYKLSEGRDVR